MMEFPPGFRFRPRDEELILHYLAKKIRNEPLPYDHIIHDVVLYNYSPDQLAAMVDNNGEDNWYFFTPREKKYLGGNRPSRSVAGDLGFWKLIGKVKKVEYEGVCVGKNMTLSFYKGKQSMGEKTNWKMQEYIITNNNVAQPQQNNNSSMRLDDWVLCRIYQSTYDENNKNNNGGDSNDIASTSNSQNYQVLMAPTCTGNATLRPPPQLSTFAQENIGVEAQAPFLLQPSSYSNNKIGATMMRPPAATPYSNDYAMMPPLAPICYSNDDAMMRPLAPTPNSNDDAMMRHPAPTPNSNDDAMMRPPAPPAEQFLTQPNIDAFDLWNEQFYAFREFGVEPWSMLNRDPPSPEIDLDN